MMTLQTPTQTMIELTIHELSPHLLTVFRPHPLTDALERRSNAWCLENLRDALPMEALQHVLDIRMVVFSLACHPLATEQRAIDICDLYAFMTIVDDIFDKVDPKLKGLMTAGSLLDPLRDAITRGALAGGHWPSFIKVLLDLLARVEARMPESQWQRMRAAVLEYIDVWVNENAIGAGRGPTDYESWIDGRVADGAIGIVLIMTEYGHEIDLSHELASSPDLHAMGRAALTHTMLVNDLFSYRKEYFHGDLSKNTITFLRQTENLSLQGAVDRLCGLIVATENQFHALRRQVLAGEFGDRLPVQSYAQGLECLMAGNLYHSYAHARYHTVGHVWNGVTHGKMLLYPDRTVFVGEQ